MHGTPSLPSGQKKPPRHGVGAADGDALGLALGATLGPDDGDVLGLADGAALGLRDAAAVDPGGQFQPGGHATFSAGVGQ